MMACHFPSGGFWSFPVSFLPKLVLVLLAFGVFGDEMCEPHVTLWILILG